MTLMRPPSKVLLCEHLRFMRTFQNLSSPTTARRRWLLRSGSGAESEHHCSTSPSAHAHLSLEQQHAILPLDRARPEMGAPHRERGVRRVDDDALWRMPSMRPPAKRSAPHVALSTTLAELLGIPQPDLGPEQLLWRDNNNRRARRPAFATVAVRHT